MSTPFEKVQNVFHSKFQSKIELPKGLEEQFFINAISEFNVELYPIEFDEFTFEIEDNLSVFEINLLGTLMYKEYLHRERDKTLKLNNIVGKDIKLTALGNSKYAMNNAYNDLQKEISKMTNKLKPMNFDE
ncbi:hypothetical protein [Siminovitchia fordii]|uniref:Uncharacterized protein n=1 Tax=Siminovitchia fordii TaxID=254759 RepID=A0ABQ4KBI9_9BACI|nr:hypothetical protein [Siminovitchia fordii]GIN23110.1 hypothetical protein J1TS3_42440 [Siminovitchia fordii]